MGTIPAFFQLRKDRNAKKRRVIDQELSTSRFFRFFNMYSTKSRILLVIIYICSQWQASAFQDTFGMGVKWKVWSWYCQSSKLHNSEVTLYFVAITSSLFNFRAWARMRLTWSPILSKLQHLQRIHEKPIYFQAHPVIVMRRPGFRVPFPIILTKPFLLQKVMDSIGGSFLKQ